MYERFDELSRRFDELSRIIASEMRRREAVRLSFGLIASSVAGSLFTFFKADQALAQTCSVPCSDFPGGCCPGSTDTCCHHLFFALSICCGAGNTCCISGPGSPTLNCCTSTQSYCHSGNSNPLCCSAVTTCCTSCHNAQCCAH